jgi:hypothetical protein
LNDLSDPNLEVYRGTALGRFEAAALSGRAAPWVFLAIVLAAMVMPSIQMVRKINETKSSILRDERGRSALGRWLLDAEALRAGEDPYGVGHWFPTPPLNLMAIVPLSHLSPTAAGTIWCGAKIAAALGAFWWMARVAGPGGGAVPLGVLLLTFLFSFRAIVSDLQHGNLNLFMLAAVCACLGCALRGRDVMAGVWLALAIVIKVTPALLAVYFLYKRAWRVLAGVAAGLLLFVIIAPSLYLGFERNLTLLGEWFNTIVAPYALHGFISDEIANQSLPAALMRIAEHMGWFAFEASDANLSLQTGAESMARPTTPAGTLFLRGGPLLILAALAWLCRGGWDRWDRGENPGGGTYGGAGAHEAESRNAGVGERARASANGAGDPGSTSPRAGRVCSDPRLPLEFALVLLAMLLISERTWKHHAVTLAVVFMAVWRVLATEDWSNRFTMVFVAGLCVQWAMLVGSSEGILGDEGANLLMYNSVFCWGLVLCFGQTACLLSMFRPRRMTSQLER